MLGLYGVLGVLNYVVNFIAAGYGLSFMWKAVECAVLSTMFICRVCKEFFVVA